LGGAELAVAQDPTMMTAAVNVGLVYAAQNKWAEALATCEPLQQRFHGYGMLDYCLGLGYMNTNRFTDAVALLLSAGRAPDGPQHNVRGIQSCASHAASFRACVRTRCCD